MLKRNRKNKFSPGNKPRGWRLNLHPETKRSVWAIAFIGLAIILLLAGFQRAGPAGDWLYKILAKLTGWGYFILPLGLLVTAAVFLFSKRQKAFGVTLLGAMFLVLSSLGLLELFAPGQAGWLGLVLGSLVLPFGKTAAAVINVVIFLIAVLVTINVPLRIKRPEETEKVKEVKPVITEIVETIKDTVEETSAETAAEEEKIIKVDPKKSPAESVSVAADERRRRTTLDGKKYVAPPLSLLKSATERPTTGDLRANANIIKRTLDGFGVPVEMGEINIGPKVTRYTLKPAEGIKLSRITALNQDLALALAAHPIRIEAPIPGKSLVGIEVPNKAAALVRLGSLMVYPEFQKSGPLVFVLGRDVSGEPVTADIAQMPHLLIAGATGSGKSVMIHSLIVSLLYKNSPERLKLILIDPKRVELSTYENIPHLVSPVITDSKKAMAVFRWAINEMERRYNLLQEAGNRDIKGYNANGRITEPLPYLLIVIDEMADLMTSYGREVEGSIVRLAQMARATGLHLILATQRPSVEIITGLIKANITSRIALQVASQIDSRTILDTSGAEKLLGGGDLLFIAAELSKPKRIQASYISEGEIDKVTDFIKENNRTEFAANEEISSGNSSATTDKEILDDYLEDKEDELYDEAVKVVAQAKKASASLLQRRLKVGYARAARLLDLMEADGLIGYGEGAKPREIFIEKISAKYKNEFGSN